MEVLFITHKYPPSIGGMEKQSYELINGTAKHFKVHSLIYDSRVSRVRFLITAPFRARAIIKKNPGISIIHTNDGLMGFFAVFIKRFTHRPVLATLHGLEVVIPSNIFQNLIVSRYKKLDGVIAVSRATADECLKRGFDPMKVFVVRNGVDTEMSLIKKKPGYRRVLSKKLGIDLESKKILVSIGRSVRRKGFSWFIKHVMPGLNDDIVYLQIGPPQPHIKKINFLLNLLPDRLSHLVSLVFALGVDEIEVHQAMSRPDVRGRAYYLGKLPFQDMVQILKSADLYVMPNIKVFGDAEGFGLVALEASINGLPVIASAIEGITCAVIDGRNGFLVQHENPMAWIKNIHRLLSDTEALRRFGESAMQYTIDNYSWKRMVEGYIDVFKLYHFRYMHHKEKIARNKNSRQKKITESYAT
jgi:phosphatidylinositol alpha-1,6-mannosyltransferase